MTAGFVGLFGQGGYGAVQELVLQLAKRPFKKGAVLRSEPAIEIFQQALQNSPAFGFQVFREPGDQWPVSPPSPVADEFSSFMLHDGLRRTHVLPPII